MSSIVSGLSPVWKVTTGVPDARDSRFVVGKLSAIVGLTKTDAPAYIDASSPADEVGATDVMFSIV